MLIGIIFLGVLLP